ncbi:MAG: c-type cytochrome [Vicinamibacterales bacterium]
MLWTAAHHKGAAVAIIVWVTGVFAQAPTPAAPVATQAVGNVQNGKRVYMEKTCFFCHGTVGQGAGNTGARLTPPARNLAGFIHYIRRPAGSMPAYTEQVISEIPLLNQLKQP